MNALQNLKRAFSAVTDQLNVMHEAASSDTLNDHQKTALQNDIKVALEDRKMMGGLIKTANENGPNDFQNAMYNGPGLTPAQAEVAPPQAASVSIDETLNLASDGPDPLFSEPSRSEVFASNRDRVKRILDKLGNAQERVQTFEGKFGANSKTAAFRKRVSALMRKVAEGVDEGVDLAEDVSSKTLAEVESEVDNLNEQEQAGQYDVESTGDLTLEMSA
jgi:hypothetical protein